MQIRTCRKKTMFLVYYRFSCKKSIYLLRNVNFFDLFFSKIQRVFTISRLIYPAFIFIIKKIVRRNEMDNNLDNNQGGRRPDKGDPRRNQDPNRNKKNHQSILAFLICLLVTLVCFSLFTNMLQDNSSEITYDKFIDMVNNDEVKSVTLQSDNLTIVPKKQVNPYQEISYYTNLTEDETALTKRLEGTGIIFKSEPPDAFGEFMAMMLSVLLPSVLLFVLLMFFMRRMNKGGGGMMGVGKSRAKAYVQKETGITFKDVAGQDEAKESLQEVVEFLHNPGKYVEIGAKLPKGALLVGPPGTGKTLLAKAVAGEAHVPFFSLSGSEFVEMFVGVGASRVRDLFEEAKKNAPCIVFIDEIDAIGKSRDSHYGGGNDEREQTLNQLLTEMDGFEGNNGVIILAATNRPESLDPALTRPGRFDRRVPVELPDLAGREAILKVHARKIKASDDVDFHTIARMASGASGAELANIINEAALRAVRSGRTVVTEADLEESIEVVIAGYQKKNAVLSDQEKKVVSYHEIGHALVAALQSHSAPVQKITIIPRTSGALGYTMQVETGDKYLMTKKELENKIATFTGGRAAEEIVFGEITTGASNDIEQATKIARAMITRYGMTDEFDMVAMETVTNQYLGGDASLSCSADTQKEIDEKVVELVKREHEKAKKILTDNRKKLDELAMFLYEKETITGEEFMEILNKKEESEEK